MDYPTLIFGFLIATALGALYHLLRGGRAGRLLIFLLAGWLGFAAGQWFGVKFGITVFKLGGLYLAPALSAGVLFLLLSDWLSLIEPEMKKRR